MQKNKLGGNICTVGVYIMKILPSNFNQNLTYGRQNQLTNNNVVMPSFNGSISSRDAANFIKKDLNSFIEKHQPLCDDLKSLINSCKDEVVKINKHSAKPKFNPSDFDEITRLKLDRIDENQTLFNSLKTKSEKAFNNPDAKEYADSLVEDDSFFIPSYLKSAYLVYSAMKKNIKNGLANITLEKLAPAIAEKRNNLLTFASDAKRSMRRFSNVLMSKQSLDKSLEKNFYDQKTIDKIEDAKRNMEMHEGRIPTITNRIKDGKEILEANKLSEEDNKLLDSMHKRAKKIIKHNVKEFNENPLVANTYLGDKEIILENQLNEQATKLIRLANKLENN